MGIEGGVREAISKGLKGACKSLDVLYPDFDPTLNITAHIDENAEKHLGIPGSAEHNEIPGYRVGFAADKGT
ncbi:MAG: hypothetical protein ABSH08_09975 [Tepidisphaeraceae bacterium]